MCINTLDLQWKYKYKVKYETERGYAIDAMAQCKCSTVCVHALLHGNTRQKPFHILWKYINILAWNIESHLIWFDSSETHGTRALSSRFYYVWLIWTTAIWNKSMDFRIQIMPTVWKSFDYWFNSIHFVNSINGLKSIIEISCAKESNTYS